MPIDHLPSPTGSSLPAGLPPLDEDAPSVGGTVSAVPIEQLTLQELKESFQEAVDTYVLLTGTEGPDNPQLSKPTLDDNGFNEWMQNGGLVEVIFAKMETAMADAQAQLANSKMVSEFALDIFELSMDKARSMLKEADLIREKGQLEAQQMYIQAAMSLVSMVVTVGLAYKSHKDYKHAQTKAQNQNLPNQNPNNQLNVRPDAPSANAPAGPKLHIQAVPPSGGGVAHTPPPTQAGIQPAPLGGANDPSPQGNVAPKISVQRVNPNANAVDDLELDVQKGAANKQPKMAIDPGKLQRLNFMDQTLKGLSDSFMQAVNGFISGAYKGLITEKEVDLKTEQANQARMDAMITMLQSVMEVMRRFVDAASNRIDQNYNWSALFQALAVGFQKL